MDLHAQIQPALRGERPAQRALFAALAPRAYRVAVRYLGEGPDAEDAVQEAMARVFRGLASFDLARARLTTWAHAIAAREALRVLRKRAPLVFPDAEALPPVSDAEPLATDHLAAADLRALIARLSDGYRAVFNLAAVEGVTDDEIAEALGISPATSRSQLTRARRQLRTWIEARRGSDTRAKAKESPARGSSMPHPTSPLPDTLKMLTT